MAGMPRILVADDDPRLVRVVSTLLRRRQHQVESAATGELARKALVRGDIDLLLLEVNLPDVDGFTFVYQLREEGNTTPVILVTTRSEAQDEVIGLRMGADDYVTKPFNHEVLLARIAAVLRRAQHPAPVTSPGPAGVLDLPNVRIDLAARQVLREGAAVRLAPLEYAVLEFLAVNRGRAVSREELMLQVWGSDLGLSRTLAEHISRLRKKLGDGLIVTQTGFGYLIPGPGSG
jgi:DNA-binding response OmpR family regulator